MLQRELETKLHNIMIDLFEKYSYEGRTKYDEYLIGLYGHDMEKMMELLRCSGVFTRINKTGEAKARFEVDPLELKEWIKCH